MRVLLDECLPRRLRVEIPGHEVVTVGEAGWAGKGNGELLALAGGNFDVLLTVDQNLPSQQNIRNSGVGVIVLIARSNRTEHLSPLIPDVLKTLETISPGDLKRIGPS
jgi:predicted nuclease of predicted toxin-antitoxin system